MSNEVWRHRYNQCHSGCDPAFDFMEFGGLTVYDASDYAESWACPKMRVHDDLELRINGSKRPYLVETA